METAWQSSLFADATGMDDTRLPDGFVGLRRLTLAEGAWLDHVPGWVPGADALVERVLAVLPWREGTERIHGDDVLRPRLTAHLRLEELPEVTAPLPALGPLLSERYGVRFTRVGCNLYRHGRDSVAWHGDRIVRDLPTSTIAIVSLGEARPFRYRPAAGGPAAGMRLGHGDLLVMGGTFQRTWRHAVPKQRVAGPRISVTYRTDVGR